MKIMFATDGSDYAAEAAKMLASMEVLRPMDLTVITVSYAPDQPAMEAVRPWDRDYQKFIEDRVGKHCQSMRELLGSTSAVQMKHRHGNPTQEILSTVQQEQPDLVVLGAKGHSMLERIFLGSVSENVALHADCSVLVLRHSQREDDFKMDRVLLAYDGSQGAKLASQELAGLAWPEDTEIEALSVAQLITAWSEFGMTSAELPDPKSLRDMHVNELYEELSGELPILTTNVICANHVGEAIVQHASETQTDLIMVGQSGHGAVEQFLLGSTSKYVLRHADCSVWVSRCSAATHEAVAGQSEVTSRRSPPNPAKA